MLIEEGRIMSIDGDRDSVASSLNSTAAIMHVVSVSEVHQRKDREAYYQRRIGTVGRLTKLDASEKQIG